MLYNTYFMKFSLISSVFPKLRVGESETSRSKTKYLSLFFTISNAEILTLFHVNTLLIILLEHITLVYTIFGTKKQNTFFFADLMVLIPKMTLFFIVSNCFCCTVIARLWKKINFRSSLITKFS